RCWSCSCFFFQAEDGIRDFHVTGVQTCALPIYGKGQFRIRSLDDVDAAWQALGAQAQKVGLILEAFVPFERELSVVAVRGRDGEIGRASCRERVWGWVGAGGAEERRRGRVA